MIPRDARFLSRIIQVKWNCNPLFNFLRPQVPLRVLARYSQHFNASVVRSSVNRKPRWINGTICFTRNVTVVRGTNFWIYSHFAASWRTRINIDWLERTLGAWKCLSAGILLIFGKEKNVFGRQLCVLYDPMCSSFCTINFNFWLMNNLNFDNVNGENFVAI